MKPALALIVLGGLLLLGSVAVGVIARERAMDRVAEFYQKQGNSAGLPHYLHPDAFGPTEAFGFMAGGVMVLAGIWRSRSRAEAPDAEPGAAADPASKPAGLLSWVVRRRRGQAPDARAGAVAEPPGWRASAVGRPPSWVVGVVGLVGPGCSGRRGLAERPNQSLQQTAPQSRGRC